MITVMESMNAKAFLNTVLNNVFDSMHTIVTDNYDARRFSYDGVDRSNIFDSRRHASYMALFTEKYEAFYSTWLLLSDAVSRERFLRLIQYRLLGHLHCRINDAIRAGSDNHFYQTVAGWETGASPLAAAGMFGTLRHFENIEFGDQQLRLDCWPGNVVSTFLKRQYYFERSDVRIQPEAGDTVIDAGACLGDTAVCFAVSVGHEGKVYSFDPLPTHVSATKHNIEQNGFGEHIAIIPMAVGDATRHTDMKITADQGVSPGFSIVGQEDSMPMTTIDDFVETEKIGRIDFIKMDIEGAELAALRGGVKTLVRDRPKLAISLYHRPEDFFTIPQFLSSVLPSYDFYLEHYKVHSEETVLYGRPRWP